VVTLTARNELVELPAHGRPHPLRRFATVRQPNSVVAEPVTGRVFVTGRTAGVVQVLDP
jgi:DNA-binding beta-propeller fold protein YncE